MKAFEFFLSSDATILFAYKSIKCDNIKDVLTINSRKYYIDYGLLASILVLLMLQESSRYSGHF